jgi:hypothetical protein
LLIYWVGADDGATQSDSEFNKDSVSDESSDADEASKLSFESVKPRRPTVEKSERVIDEDTPAPAPAAALEAPDSECVELGWGWPRRPTVEKSERVIDEDTFAPVPAADLEAPDSEFVELGWGSSKKSKKKSKISAARAVFEED